MTDNLIVYILVYHNNKSKVDINPVILKKKLRIEI